MDSLAFRAANILSGNPQTTEGLEIVVVPGLDFEAKFHVAAVVAVTGKEASIYVDDDQVETWKPIVLSGGSTLSIRATDGQVPGMRNYLSVRGGFPNVPQYLGSKSTSMGLGGYQVSVYLQCTTSAHSYACRVVRCYLEIRLLWVTLRRLRTNRPLLSIFHIVQTTLFSGKYMCSRDHTTTRSL